MKKWINERNFIRDKIDKLEAFILYLCLAISLAALVINTRTLIRSVTSDYYFHLLYYYKITKQLVLSANFEGLPLHLGKYLE